MDFDADDDDGKSDQAEFSCDRILDRGKTEKSFSNFHLGQSKLKLSNSVNVKLPHDCIKFVCAF